jgi:iron(II)-dependent oxidoreductase
VVSTTAARASGRPAVGIESSSAADDLAGLLTEVRERTLELVAPLTVEDAVTQHDPLMSPVVWDLGHIARFEELWLLRHLEQPFNGVAPLAELPGTFNPFEHPRRSRGALALPDLDEALELLATIRLQVFERMACVELDADSSPLTRDGYVYRMVAQHEAQHDETILQTLQLKRGEPYHPVWSAPVPEGRRVNAEMVRFPGGRVRIGTDDRRAAYDNERPSHDIDLAAFDIDATPVTNGAYLAFIAAGGYAKEEWWSPEGRLWLRESGAIAPKYWYRSGGEWWTRTMDRSAPVDREHPVVHVCYYEADAFARWAGKRLPTEFEWEAAATWDPRTGTQRPWPWGRSAPAPTIANVGQVTFGTAPIGAYPRNVSPVGCYGMIGDVWEWTSSDFGPYPQYVTFPYREYSEAFFGPEYKVLRGGSWATSAIVGRSTFRNWDYPIRRQIFSGFRCARDA